MESKSNRRGALKCLALGLSGVGLAVVQSHAQAQTQTFPDRPIKIVVPAVAGSAYDIFARRYAPYLSEVLGQPVVVLVPA